MRNEASGKSRINAIDCARTIALIAMAIYHFAWDLEFFGYAASGMTAHGSWKLFARGIASSFLVLAGASLVLAHAKAINWPSFWRRLAMVAGAAAAITLVTWFAVPQGFIYFGILHQIALASLLGLAFLRLPFFINALLAAGIVALPLIWRDDVFLHPVLLWTGLAPFPPVSNDYVPVFPWFGAFLAGIALAQIGQRFGMFEAMRQNAMLARLPGWAGFAGRHSLAFYLVHQPVLIALVWAWAQVMPPKITVGDARPACEAQCVDTRDEAFCRAYCLCLLESLDAKGILTPVMSGRADADMQSTTEAARDVCVAETENGKD